MRGTVKLFAILREMAGQSEMDWELDEGATVEMLVAHLQKTLPGLNNWNGRFWIAVNYSYTAMETSLQDGDEVALFPPVSGG